jgi:hypothetical protein
MHVEVTEVYKQPRPDKGRNGAITTNCRRCTMQDQLNLFTMTVRAMTGCHQLWALSGTLRGNSDEPVNWSQLVRAQLPELQRAERAHLKYFNDIWTKKPKKYRDPNWSGRLSPTVTYYTLPNSMAAKTEDDRSSTESTDIPPTEVMDTSPSTKAMDASPTTETEDNREDKMEV